VTLFSIITLCVLALAMALVVARLVRGPTLADRVVAIDMLTAVAIGFIAAYVAGTGATALLDAALVLALVAFMATVAFARFVEGRAPTNESIP
jgi:multicomponent Na+:H+ antiporter subunit F